MLRSDIETATDLETLRGLALELHESHDRLFDVLTHNTQAEYIADLVNHWPGSEATLDAYLSSLPRTVLIRLAAGRDKPAPVFNVGDKVTVKGIDGPGIVVLAPRVSSGKYSVRLYANGKNVSAVANSLRPYAGPLPKFFVGDNVAINGDVFGVVKCAPIHPDGMYTVKVADRHLTAHESELS